ncbi:hypothetical protein JTE90_001839 [Oedothorax gibbosus]|uniref:Uncharacterized protein n=1 Tax=Oedothorax gibbosus TaxID=931172 RepID=A0AAV6U6R8_9ARAC|nr:hypothetical protein JTE90_001839 [Oedothorax gibbosus]
MRELGDRGRHKNQIKMPGMISAMPAVAVRRGRKKSFGRFGLPPSHHSSLSSISGRTRSFTSRGGRGANRAFRTRRKYDSDLDRQRRRFLVYMGTLCFISGLMLLFIGVGAAVPMAQNVGLLLIGVGAVLCIIKVFCSEAHATEVPRKIIVTDVDVESNHSSKNEEDAAGEEGEAATPLEKISEFTELTIDNNVPTSPPAQDGSSTQNSVTPTSPPNSIPETAVLIGNDSGARY